MWCMPFAPRPGFLLGPLPVSPNDNTGPHSNGFEHRTTVADILASPPHFATPVCTNLCHPSHVPPADTNAPSEPPDMIALRPTILDNLNNKWVFDSRHWVLHWLLEHGCNVLCTRATVIRDRHQCKNTYGGTECLTVPRKMQCQEGHWNVFVQYLYY